MPVKTEKHPWLEWIKKVHAVAHWGLTYSKDEFDLERYEVLRQLSLDMLSDFSTIDKTRLSNLFDNDQGYITPKVDVRGVVFQEGKILMVQEKSDGLWSIPGGWADIGLSPSQVAVKEIAEEAGYQVKPQRLLAILDKQFYKHPVSAFHIYKVFIECAIVEGQASAGLEALSVGFFGEDMLPPLSTNRITQEQIALLFKHYRDPSRPADFS